MKKQERAYYSSGALVYFEQANDFMEKGQFKQAIRLYNQAIDAAPNFSLAYSMRRLAERSLKRPSVQKLKFENTISVTLLLILVFTTFFIVYLSWMID